MPSRRVENKKQIYKSIEKVMKAKTKREKNIETIKIFLRSIGGDAELRENKLFKRFAIYPKGSETPCTDFLPLETLVYYMLGVLNSESTIRRIKNG